jgi:hypothetical protein
MDDLLVFDGISRSVLEARIRALVGMIEALEARLGGRVESCGRTRQQQTHGSLALDAHEALVRQLAYAVARDDLRELLGDALRALRE